MENISRAARVVKPTPVRVGCSFCGGLCFPAFSPFGLAVCEVCRSASVDALFAPRAVGVGANP